MALTAGSNGQVILQANFNVMKGQVFGSNATIDDDFPAINQALAIGSAAGQFNWEWCETGTVASGTPVTINLTSGLTASNGQSPVFADIVLLAISAPGTNGANITLGGGSNEVTSILGSGTVTVIPGATVVVYAPVASAYAITASTACNLQISAASGTQTFNIMVVGH